MANKADPREVVTFEGKVSGKFRVSKFRVRLA